MFHSLYLPFSSFPHDAQHVRPEKANLEMIAKKYFKHIHHLQNYIIISITKEKVRKHSVDITLMVYS